MPMASAREKGRHPEEAAPIDVAAGTLSVLVLVDEAAERVRLSTLIGAMRGLCCIGTVDGTRAQSTRARPDVVLLALDPDELGADRALRVAVERWKPAPVLVLSASDDDDANCGLVRKGARGVLRKAREAEQLGTAIRKVSDGEIWLSRGSLSRLIDDMAAGATVSSQAITSGTLSSLTEREREVVAHIAEGMHNRAIAQKLGITENTVRHHLTAIYGKLGVADRLELAVHALRHRVADRTRK